MTSPFSSNLLQEPVDTARPSAPGSMPTRSVTRVVAAPQPMYAPQYAPAQPQFVIAAPGRVGNALTNVVLALVVVLVGIAAIVGGYYATKAMSPSAEEAAAVTRISMGEAARAGRQSGVEAGRTAATDNASTIAAMRTATARQQAYAAAFRRGERAGRASYQRPAYSGYRGGYSGRRTYGGIGETALAFGQAQNLANLTGAPVDVEIY